MGSTFKVGGNHGLDITISCGRSSGCRFVEEDPMQYRAFAYIGARLLPLCDRKPSSPARLKLF